MIIHMRHTLWTGISETNVNIITSATRTHAFNNNNNNVHICISSMVYYNVVCRIFELDTHLLIAHESWHVSPFSPGCFSMLLISVYEPHPAANILRIHLNIFTVCIGTSPGFMLSSWFDMGITYVLVIPIRSPCLSNWSLHLPSFSLDVSQSTTSSANSTDSGGLHPKKNLIGTSKYILRIGITSMFLHNWWTSFYAMPHGRRLSNHSRIPSPAELFSFRHRVHSFVLKLHNCHLFVVSQVLKLLRRFGAFDYADNCVYGKRVLALILSYYVRRVCEPFALSILCGEAEAYLSPLLRLSWSNPFIHSVSVFGPGCPRTYLVWPRCLHWSILYTYLRKDAYDLMHL